MEIQSGRPSFLQPTMERSGAWKSKIQFMKGNVYEGKPSMACAG
jgi:hypothetical protein